MYTYIKNNVENYYVEFETPISQELNGNDLGTTYEDYANGKWVLLNTEQLAFKEEHPTASVKEVFDMQLTPVPVRTLEEAKEEKLIQIEIYDQSAAVNEFIYYGVSMWLDKATRDGLHLRFLAEQAAGKTTTTLWFGTQSFSLNIDDAFQLLYALEVYASACYDQTAAHKAAVVTLENIADVDAYDYTQGYPTKLIIGSV